MEKRRSNDTSVSQLQLNVSNGKWKGRASIVAIFIYTNTMQANKAYCYLHNFGTGSTSRK